MAELLLITRATREDEKPRNRRGHALQPRELFATGDQRAATDCVRQIGLAP